MQARKLRLHAQTDAGRRRFTMALAAAVCAPLAACGGGGGGGGGDGDGDGNVGPGVQVGWSTNGELLAQRSDHSAVLLDSGRVLVMGGGIAASEIYDPAAGRSQAAGAMVQALRDFTATLLPDGKVLVVGGLTPAGVAVAAAQLFDPATQAWTAAAPPAQARFGHTATLMADGRVLVLGGSFAGYADMAGAEFYNPATGTWSAAPPIARRRFRHTATRLRDGRVLVVGGLDGGDPDIAAIVGGSTAMYIPTATVELFDPAAGTWSDGTRRPTGRFGHTATLLADGRVLVAGGSAGADAPLPLFDAAEIFDAATDAWSASGVALQKRYLHQAALLPDGRVLVAGGTTERTGILPSLPDAFLPAPRTWVATTAMMQPRVLFPLVTLADGTVLALGGSTGPGTLASVEAYR